MHRNTALFATFASATFVFLGSVILLALTFEGIMHLEGIALGAGVGFWLGLGFMIGRAIYGERRNTLGLIVFMLCALVVGLVYHFNLQLPYVNAHRDVVGFLEQIGGMVWALSFAAVYLSYEQYRQGARS